MDELFDPPPPDEEKRRRRTATTRSIRRPIPIPPDRSPPGLD
jgi:hypothetical protein